MLMDEDVLPKGEMVNVQMVLVGCLAGGGGGQSKAKKGGKEKTFLDVGLKEEEYSGFDDDAPGNGGADWQKEKAALKKENKNFPVNWRFKNLRRNHSTSHTSHNKIKEILFT